MLTLDKNICFVSGASGQIGSFMCDYLIKKGFMVVALKRRTSLINTDRIDHLYGQVNFKIEYWDLNDPMSLVRLLKKYKPYYFFHYSCQSHVAVSFSLSEETVSSIVMGTLRILEVLREICPNIRFYNSSSSEMFGSNKNIPFDEESKFIPVSPYAVAKSCIHQMVDVYRKSFNMFVVSGITFNTESERRGETFLPRKVSMAVANIKNGLQDKLEIGNLESFRDWGYVGDVVKAHLMMLQNDIPEDFVIATGTMISVKELIERMFNYVNLDYKKYVIENSKFKRPLEVDQLCGNYNKIKNKLGWEPNVNVDTLIQKMIDYDLSLVKQQIAIGANKWKK